MNKEIEEIANQLNEFIQEQISQRVPEFDIKNHIENQVEQLTWQYEDLLNNAKSLLENYKDEGFTYSCLDAEGYLRGVITAKNLFDEIFKNQSLKI